MMLAILVLVTKAMLNAQTATPKSSEAKEVIIGKQKKIIEKSKLPKVVTETFTKEFPVVTEESWFYYPKFDFEKDWYGHDPYSYTVEKPEFIVVEFTKDNVKHKAIYSKEGKKIAVHKKFTSQLPTIITTAIANSKYRAWKIALEKEVVFKDTEMDKIKVYKTIVQKDNQKHKLYYSTEGYLLKDKTIK